MGTSAVASLSVTAVTVTVAVVVLLRVTLVLVVDHEYVPPLGLPVAVIVVELTYANELAGGLPVEIGTPPPSPTAPGVVNLKSSTATGPLGCVISLDSTQ